MSRIGLPKNSTESNRRNNIKQTAKVRDYINHIKSDGCALCGYKKCLAALEFHHVKADKEFTISKLKRSLPATKREIAKCICICANCHREIHAGMVEGMENIQTVSVVDTKQLLLQFK